MYWHDKAQGRFGEDAVPLFLKRTLREPVCRLPILLEGGALLTNGDGLCLVPTSTLVRNRKRGLSDELVTSTIQRMSGASQVIYLEPLRNEPTQHVDWFATFTAVDTVVVGDYSGIDAENAAILNRNADRLRNVETSKGPLKVVRIPQPPRELDFFGGSYTNVVYANGTLLVPTWRSAPRSAEKKVLDTYQRLLPDWKIVPIECSELGRRAGALRCATMNLFRIRAPAIPSLGSRGN
jgi:agmatine/peptidylarginine deiminase